LQYVNYYKEMKMTKIIKKPTEIKAHGSKPKIIQEFIGRMNSNTENGHNINF
jgi:hypothetical protein